MVKGTDDYKDKTNNYRLEVKFDPPQDSLHHKCKSYRAGDWIVFRCALCEGYERRLNWRTGEMTVENDRVDIYHNGQHFPLEYRQIFEDIN